MTWSLDEVSNQVVKAYVSGGSPGTKKREVTLCDRCVVLGNHGFGRITGPWRTVALPTCEGNAHDTNTYVADVTTKSALETTVTAWNDRVDTGDVFVHLVCESPLELEIYDDNDHELDEKLGAASGIAAQLIIERMEAELATATKLKKTGKR